MIPFVVRTQPFILSFKTVKDNRAANSPALESLKGTDEEYEVC